MLSKLLKADKEEFTSQNPRVPEPGVAVSWTRDTGGVREEDALEFASQQFSSFSGPGSHNCRKRFHHPNCVWFLAKGLGGSGPNPAEGRGPVTICFLIKRHLSPYSSYFCISAHEFTPRCRAKLDFQKASVLSRCRQPEK